MPVCIIRCRPLSKGASWDLFSRSCIDAELSGRGGEIWPSVGEIWITGNFSHELSFPRVEISTPPFQISYHLLCWLSKCCKCLTEKGSLFHVFSFKQRHTSTALHCSHAETGIAARRKTGESKPMSTKATSEDWGMMWCEVLISAQNHSTPMQLLAAVNGNIKQQIPTWGCSIPMKTKYLQLTSVNRISSIILRLAGSLCGQPESRCHLHYTFSCDTC